MTTDEMIRRIGAVNPHAARLWDLQLLEIRSLPTAIDCPRCDGTGVPLEALNSTFDPWADDVPDCPRCGGSGVTTELPTDRLEH